MPEVYTYGVFVKPCDGIIPSDNTITGTGQVTVILPMGNNIANLANHAGLWVDNAALSGPSESPDFNYFTFGFLNDSPKIVF